MWTEHIIQILDLANWLYFRSKACVGSERLGILEKFAPPSYIDGTPAALTPIGLKIKGKLMHSMKTEASQFRTITRVAFMKWLQVAIIEQNAMNATSHNNGTLLNSMYSNWNMRIAQ